MVSTRAIKKAKVVKTDARTEYMQKYRTPEIKYKEAKLKILRRIIKGSVPHTKSLAMYNISLKEINELRIRGGLSPLNLQIPYFMKDKEKNGSLGNNDADYLPDNSQVIQFNDDFDSGENEVSSRLTADTSTPSDTVEPAKEYGYSVGEICIYIQNFRGLASQKSASKKSDSTIKNQWGKIDSKTGKFNNSGRFYNFMKLLGDEYIKDVRLTVKDDKSVKFVLQQLNKPQKSLLKNKADEDKKLETLLQYLATLLLALRQYPGFDALNNRKYLKPYNQLNKGYVEMQTKDAAEKLSNPKEQLFVMRWPELLSKVITKYPSGTKENLYIRMYDEFPSRDDFKNLFVDDKEKSVYPTQQNYESILNNTLYVRNDKPKATIVLAKYKTAGIYGTRMFEFSEELTKDIKAYIIQNKITAKKATSQLFGKTSMSVFVKIMLNSIDVPNPREGQINYLRKSYISSAMQAFKGSAEQRIKIAFHLKHSPSASLKYIRNIQENEPALKDVSVLSAEQLTIGLKADKSLYYSET